jgi:uncharacterized protein YhbP (UPF0306 family)
MDKNLKKIEAFIARHHVLTLATSAQGKMSACSLFYAYEAATQSFVVASSHETQHIKNIMQNPRIAANILLETEEIGRIEGLQIEGNFSLVEDKVLKQLYFERFPYAKVLLPTLWKIEVDFFKLTDNRLGFGKKLIWQKAFE